jgi:hypothetical protein
MIDKNKINIAPVISPDILKTVSSATAIKTFGSQLINKNKEKLIVGDQTKTAQLDNQLNDLTIREQQAGETQKATIEKAQKDFNTKQITKEQYDNIVETANITYQTEVDAINLQRDKIQQDKNNIKNDPYTKLKQNRTSIKNKLKGLKKRAQSEETKNARDLAKQVAINTAKNLAPIVALQLIRQLFNIVNQRKKLEDLVDQVNTYIDTQVKDEQTVVIATNLRNNAIRLIDNSAKKLENLKKALDRLTRTLAIISAIIAVIEAILRLPFPFLIPIKIQLQPRLQKVLTLLTGLTTILAIAVTLLENQIVQILELKERLKEISLKLDGKTLDNLDNLNALTNLFLPTGLDYPPYKGFNFKIKEEQDPRFVVKGNKRRYAVAINRDGLEQIKSEFSFTLDPNDLIEQLKLVIDQQNLQG